MRKIRPIFIFSLFTLLLSNQAHSNPVFSSITKGDQQNVFVALKDEERGLPTPRIATVNRESLRIIPLDLPKDIVGREVIALFYSNKTLIVLSQWIINSKDKPTLNTYSSKTKKWNKIGNFNCTIIDSLVFEGSAIQSKCSDGSTESIVISKKIKIAKKTIILLPQDKIYFNKNNSYWFQGSKNNWNLLSIKKNKKIQVLESLEFFDKKEDKNNKEDK